MMDIEDAHKLKILTTQETKELLLSYFSKERRAHRLKTMEIVSDTNEQIAKSRKTKRDGCEKRNAFIETKTKCASNLIRKVTVYLQNQSKTPSLYIKINGIQMDF